MVKTLRKSYFELVETSLLDNEPEQKIINYDSKINIIEDPRNINDLYLLFPKLSHQIKEIQATQKDWLSTFIVLTSIYNNLSSNDCNTLLSDCFKRFNENFPLLIENKIDNKDDKDDSDWYKIPIDGDWDMLDELKESYCDILKKNLENAKLNQKRNVKKYQFNLVTKVVKKPKYTIEIEEDDDFFGKIYLASKTMA